MKRCIAIAIGLSIVVMLAGCGAIFGNGGGSDKPTPYSETVVDTFIAQLTASSTARDISRSMTVAVTADQIQLIRTKALAQIKADNLTDSKLVDSILGSMLDGVSTAVTTINLTSDASGVLAIAARSAVISIGTATSFSSGTTAKDAVAKITVKALDVLVAVAPVSVLADLKAKVVSEAVSGIDKASDSLKSSASDIVQAIVVKVVDKSVGSSSYTPDDLANMLQAATASSYAWSSASSSGLATKVAQAAAGEVATVCSSDTSSASNFYSKIAISVSSGVPKDKSTETSTLANDIHTAVTDGGGKDSDVPDLSAILSEITPTAAATAKIGSGSALKALTMSEAATVTLLSTGSVAGAPYTEISTEWACVSGGGPVPAKDSVTITKSGTYVYQLTVYNKGGLKKATDEVTIAANISTTTVTGSLDKAMLYLKGQNFNSAKTEFAAVIASSSSSAADKSSARGWKAFLDLASLSVNADIVSLFQTNFGFTGYPSDLNTLISKSWFTKQWYNPKRAFVSYGTVAQAKADGLGEFFSRCDVSLDSTKDLWISYWTQAEPSHSSSIQGSFSGWSDSGSYFIGYGRNDDGSYYPYSYVSSNYPAFDAPPDTASAYVRYEGLVDLTKPWGMLPAISAPSWATSLIKYQASSVSALPFYVLTNVIDRNTGGFDGIIDKALSGAFGADFDSVIGAINGLGDDLSVVVPDDLIAAYAGSGPGFAITIDKPILLAFAGQLEMLKGLAQYVASYKFNVDLTPFKIDGLFGSLETYKQGSANSLPSLAVSLMRAYPGGIPGTNLLKDRSQVTRTASRTSIATGVQYIHDAASSIADKFKAGGYSVYLEKYNDLSGDAAITGEQFASDYLTPNLATAQDLHDAIITSSKSVTISVPTGSTKQSLVVYPGVLFDSAFFSPSSLLEFDGSTKAKLYLLKASCDSSSGEWTNNSIVYDTGVLLGSATSTEYQGLAMKMNLAKLETLYPDLETFLTNVGAKIGSDVGAFDIMHVGQLRSVEAGPGWSNTTVSIEAFDPNAPNVKVFKWICGYGAP
jgi:hypothetical protein